MLEFNHKIINQHREDVVMLRNELNLSNPQLFANELKEISRKLFVDLNIAGSKNKLSKTSECERQITAITNLKMVLISHLLLAPNRHQQKEIAKFYLNAFSYCENDFAIMAVFNFIFRNNWVKKLNLISEEQFNIINDRLHCSQVINKNNSVAIVNNYLKFDAIPELTQLIDCCEERLEQMLDNIAHYLGKINDLASPSSPSDFLDAKEKLLNFTAMSNQIYVIQKHFCELQSRLKNVCFSTENVYFNFKKLTEEKTTHEVLRNFYDKILSTVSAESLLVDKRAPLMDAIQNYIKCYADLETVKHPKEMGKLKNNYKLQRQHLFEECIYLAALYADRRHLRAPDQQLAKAKSFSDTETVSTKNEASLHTIKVQPHTLNFNPQLPTIDENEEKIAEEPQSLWQSGMLPALKEPSLCCISLGQGKKFTLLFNEGQQNNGTFGGIRKVKSDGNLALSAMERDYCFNELKRKMT